VRDCVISPKDGSEPRLPIVYRAVASNYPSLSDASDEMLVSHGKGWTADDAFASALGEAVEHYSSSIWHPEEILYAPRPKLDGPSLDPRELVLYAAEQYAALPYSPYSDGTSLGWLKARSLVTDELTYVPALAVFMHYQVPAPEELLFPVTSNGLATGATLPEAVLAAACELLERDAFMITWLNQLPCLGVDLCNHPDPQVVAFQELMRRRDVEIRLLRLPVDHPCHVFMALAVEPGGRGPAVVVGLGADIDAARAAGKAVLELGQIRPGFRRSMRQAETRAQIDDLIADPMRVKTMHDHALLYTGTEMLPAFAFMLEQPIEPFDWRAGAGLAPGEKLRLLAGHLGAQGQDLLYVNLTPPDMQKLGLFTVRAIIPGSQPIHFGRRERRLGGARLFELPVRLGLASAPRAPDQLNPYPHPFA
jgi:ribosomal protein S12 methylthiotransferase accessory factor